MADSDKIITTTPNTSQTSQPEIKFVGKDNSPMFLKVLDDNTLSFEGTEGQVFSISPTMSSGDIFSVSDISGVQSMAVNADGTITMNAQSKSTTIKNSASNTSTLILENTNADAIDGPMLEFYRNTPSPADGDDTGAIVWTMQTDAGNKHEFGRIVMEYSDASDGSEDGEMIFKLTEASANEQEFMRLRGGSRQIELNTAKDDIDLCYNSDATDNFFYINANTERIGIGDAGTAPSHLVHIEATGANGELFVERTSGAGILLQAQSATGKLGTNTNHDLALMTNGSTRMHIENDGDVGIGNTAPVSKLQVSGDTTIYNGTSEAHLILRRNATGTNFGSAIKWKFGDSGSSSSGHEYARITGNIQDSTDGSEDGYLTLQTSRDGTLTEAIRINKDGDVGIGTTSPAFKLDVAGFIATTDGIVHTGDTNNTITFGTDTQSFNTGSASRMDISDSGVRFGDAGARITTIKDEDAMGSNSATALATQQSIKAYVDANAGGGLSGGESVAFTHNSTATLTLEQNSTLDNALILKLIGKNNEVLNVKNTGAVFFNLSAAGGGTSEGVLTYRDTAGSARTFVTIDGGTIIHNNRGPNGDLEFRANNSTAGSSGESVKAQIKHDRVIIKSHVIGDIVSVSSGHTLTQAESGATVVWTGGVLALPADPEDGTHYLIFNLTGSDAAVNFGSGDATHSSLASGSTPQVKNDGSLHFIYVGNNDWVWTK